MTKEEAINVLKKYDVYGCGVCLQDDYRNNLDAEEALNMAIEALSEEPKCPYTDEICKMCKMCDIDKAEREWAEDYEHATLVDIKEPLKKAHADGNLIGRADAIKAIECCEIRDINDYRNFLLIDKNDAKDSIESAPSADRPSGEWQQVEIIDDDEPSGINTDASKCSVCGAIQQSHYWATHYYNYCPNCGARMEDGMMEIIIKCSDDCRGNKKINGDPIEEIVRCKDCRHRDLFSCPLTDNDFQKDDDFCSWGERRES